jgi:hypothetical protein
LWAMESLASPLHLAREDPRDEMWLFLRTRVFSAVNSPRSAGHDLLLQDFQLLGVAGCGIQIAFSRLPRTS